MILDIKPLGFHWQTYDPFLFCAYHFDKFPRGNGSFGPVTSLAGRNIGMDFEIRDGFRMYHGDKVPGFPAHPHRGFETITIVQQGLVDHADSLGAAGRYGQGDVQWLTAGRGIQHSEMIPLVNEQTPNPLLLFQLWLNLPAKNKMAPPHFSMFWNDQMPRVKEVDAAGRTIQVEITAGDYAGTKALSPPPHSWAADANNHVAAWVIDLAANAEWTLPAAVTGLNRALYFFEGEDAVFDSLTVKAMHSLRLASDKPLSIRNGSKPARLLFLQGRPINEPVAQHGPFVMNTRTELIEAFNDYQKDHFGGWPWPRHDQVHGDRQRFARYIDGSESAPAIKD
jgi:redox-sensitive bicupin YhaK (pirin superfamily)